MITIDTNVVIAALVRDGITRRVLFSLDNAVAPYFLLLELEEHRDEVLSKSGLDAEEYDKLLALLLSKIRILQISELALFAPAAADIIGDIDLDDVPFVACALAYPGSVIWSNDPHFQEQKIISVMTTAELMTSHKVKRD